MKELEIQKTEPQKDGDKKDKKKSPLKRKCFFNCIDKTSGRHAAPSAL
jgi:hypothetical protein